MNPTKMVTNIDNSLTFSTLGKKFSRQYFKVFFLFFPENKLWHFMQIVDNLHEMSKPFFLGKKYEKLNLFSAKYTQRVIKIN